MKAILVLQLAVVVATTFAFEYTEEWEVWKTKHGKIYKDDSEELHRRTIWASNKVFVEEHNKNSDKHGFTVEMNKFADLVCMLKTALVINFALNNCLCPEKHWVC